ncbi:protein of unknown function [Candidatus Nitrotoga arctica]|uniref:Uncharacterized protein n=1 Tax=Candidatus Nitrotoga arctica TaxID=453162 RepID=A0ABM8YXV9_9PROT|nr:protein of unknown function [Candidatus Nitrotoga arctica]
MPLPTVTYILRAYPRERGGNISELWDVTDIKGLSPRARGKQVAGSPAEIA